MEAGAIGAWNVKEGDSFEAGDVIAEIETDKVRWLPFIIRLSTEHPLLACKRTILEQRRPCV